MNTGTERNGEGTVNAVRQESQIVSMRGRQTPKQENGGSLLLQDPSMGLEQRKKERKNGRR